MTNPTWGDKEWLFTLDDPATAQILFEVRDQADDPIMPRIGSCALSTLDQLPRGRRVNKWLDLLSSQELQGQLNVDILAGAHAFQP